MENEFIDVFSSNEHIKELTSKILDQKVTPVNALSGIISMKTKIEMLQQSSKNQNPIL